MLVTENTVLEKEKHINDDNEITQADFCKSDIDYINNKISLKETTECMKKNYAAGDYIEILDIAEKYGCYSFEILVKKLFYSSYPIIFNDENYKKKIFDIAAQQHLKLMNIKKILFKYVTNLDGDVENF